MRKLIELLIESSQQKFYLEQTYGERKNGNLRKTEYTLEMSDEAFDAIKDSTLNQSFLRPIYGSMMALW